MSEQKKDLDYYINHPEEFPTDPEQVAKLMKELDVDEIPGVQATEEKKPDEKPAEKKEEKPAESKPADAAAAAKPDETKIDGIITKDGKNFLPYAEMERRVNEAHSSKEAEAAARKAAEDYAKELEAKLTAAQADAAKLKAGAGAKAAEAVATELPADLMDSLRADFPTHAKAIEALQAGIKSVEESNKKLREELAARIEVHDRDRTESVQSDVETLIEGNADLKAWRSKGGLLWDAAQSTEDAILADSKFLKEHLAKTGVDLVKDDAARYVVVAARVKQELGLPATASPKDETKEDLSRKAEEKVGAASPATIRSLSDIQGGQPPAGNLEDNLENASSADLADKLMRMSEEQRQQWLARVS